MNMLIKSYCLTKLYSPDVIKIHTCYITMLILIIRILVQFHLSVLIESPCFSYDKGEVMHNEETI